MIRPALALSALALVIGCQATSQTPAPVAVTLSAPPAPVEVVEGDVPFKGVYVKRAKIAYKKGARFHPSNDGGESRLRIDAGKVTYEQTYNDRSEKRHVVQVYSFETRDVKTLEEGAFEVALTFSSISGHGNHYSPDKEDPRLMVRKRNGDWEIGLLTADVSGAIDCALFDAIPGDAPAAVTAAEDVAYKYLLSLSDRAEKATGKPLILPPPPNVAAAPPDAVKTPSGLATKVLAPGTGKDHPQGEDGVKVHYSGWTSDGKMIDSTILHGEPRSFRANGLIKGLSEGIQLMVTGEKRRLWIPAQIAYASSSRHGAPVGDVVYDVELLELSPAPKPPQVPTDVKRPPPNAKRLPSGLAYRVLKKGTGQRSPQLTDTVEVHYSGWTTDGKMFDSSVTRGQPASFKPEQLIKGWAEALQLMKEGDHFRLWIPANLAYGDKQSVPGRPYGMLVFDVELISIK
ncbi:FKBP-type peptidyl-prolyl cis-trans isomerase FklB [Minicystis rosea]|nr:FKBP-type peptidyl-prolyl cis-trans isomerase FklB [Minicystis rosea]